jgi:hypothetical protein
MNIKYIRICDSRGLFQGRPTVLILARRDRDNPYKAPLRATWPRIIPDTEYMSKQLVLNQLAAFIVPLSSEISHSKCPSVDNGYL